MRFPVKITCAPEALYCNANCGPVFSKSLFVSAYGWSPTAAFDTMGSHCNSQRASCYQHESDTPLAGEGFKFTDSASDGRFMPVELEVYAASQT